MPEYNYYNLFKASLSEVREESPYGELVSELAQTLRYLNHEVYSQTSTRELQRSAEQSIARLNNALVAFREENVQLSSFSDDDGRQAVSDYVAASNTLRLAEALAMTAFLTYR